MMRLRQADWLITTSPKSLTEIALACGFADAAHLSRNYRKAFGASPSQARQQPNPFMAHERRAYREPPDAAAP
jgi:transcriptional regulator GlxA family with amidase domain